MTHQDAASNDITRLLLDWRAGDAHALDSLVPLVYKQLKQMAHHHMRGEGILTLQATALVHEAYIRLVAVDVQWQDRAHFFALASSMMRRILVDEAKRRRAAKRGNGETMLLIEEIDGVQEDAPVADLLALDEALSRLGELDERKMRVIELRFFAGLTIAECVDVLGVSHATVERDLKMARAWLANQITDEPDGRL